MSDAHLPSSPPTTPAPAPAAPAGDAGSTKRLIDFPASVWQQLALKAVQEGTTARALVLMGLAKIGINVPAEELVDRRTLRKRRPG